MRNRIRYTDDDIKAMRMFYESLSEKDRRRYAAVEAMKLGFGGQKYISEMLECMPDTIKVGTDEFLSGNLNEIGGIRR